MNILLLGEYNDFNRELFEKFKSSEDIICKKYWTNGVVQEDCFFGEPSSECFKSSIFNILFDISFEPDAILVSGDTVLDCWGISSIKRSGYFSSKCYSLIRNVVVPFDGLSLAIYETFEKNFIMEETQEFSDYSGILKEYKESDMVKKVSDSFVVWDENWESIFEKIIKDINCSEQNIDCNEVII